jgi:hypothetical protein
MERHNERKNEHYGNGDVDLSRAEMNVHFKRCDGTYLQAFDNMLADGTVSTKGLKKDGSSNILNELIFDVNTEYFEENGGYEYAKSFFDEAYRMAAKEAGGEQFVLSAVMHADERNKALSEKLGRDVYHYHLHVIFIPVVQKEVKWTTRCKDPALVGTVKEVINQVSNSKKWQSGYENGDNGKKRLVYSYSLLQDRYHDHMKEAGFTGFVRGEKGSTAEHLDVLDYKIKQDVARAETLADVVMERQEAVGKLTAAVDEKQQTAITLDTSIGEKEQATAKLDKAIIAKEQTAAKLDERAEKKQKQLESLDKKTAVRKEEAATFAEIDAMAKPSVLSANLQISPADWKKVSALAKEGVKSKGIIAELKSKVAKLLENLGWYKKRLEKYEGKGITDQMRYFEARERAPGRLADTVADIMRMPPEMQADKERQATS